jgi:aminomethyltransferase
MKRTPLYDWHVSSGARMIDFGGWEMPLQYTGIADEHMNVRKRVGMFDVSHMGDIIISGKGAGSLVGRLMTNDPAGMAVGKGIYGHILDDDGKIIDDAILYRVEEEAYLLVPNASMTRTVFDWIDKHRDGQDISDMTDAIACFAVQGPEAATLMERLTDQDLSSLKKFHFIMLSLGLDGQPKDVVTGLRPPLLNDKEVGIDPEEGGVWSGGPFGSRVMLSRTGYTGEDGFEVLCDPRSAVAIWSLIINMGRKHGLLPAGLGARDSLRMEMGYLLSGTDFDGSQSTVQTGPEWVIKWEHEFIGKEALRRDVQLGLPHLVAILLDDRGIPRHGHSLMKDGADVGHVTSGTLSPCLKKGIALGYVRPELSQPGTELTVAIRDMRVPSHVVRPPFVRK